MPNAIQLAGGLLLLALGVFVLTLRPRTRPNVAFACFVLGMGAFFSASNALSLAHVRVELRLAVFLPFYLPWALGLAAMLLTFPRPLAADERRLLVPALAIGAVAAAGRWMAADMPDVPRAIQAGTASVLGLSAAYTFLLALRYRRAADAGTRRLDALTGAALLLNVAFVAGSGTGSGHESSPLRAEGSPLLGALAFFACAIAVAVAWLVASAREDGRPARNVALLGLVAMLAGLVDAALDLRIGAPGIVRGAMVAILAYAILRHQLLGLDLKVRWTIRQSTLGAIFVAAFFVATEGAQLVFGASNPYVGIAAAGALVFALAPLQRVAERVANAAVPAPPAANPDHLALYRRQVQIAWMDGSLGANERLMLRELRAGLGIPSEEAERIEAEEAERAVRSLRP